MARRCARPTLRWQDMLRRMPASQTPFRMSRRACAALTMKQARRCRMPATTRPEAMERPMVLETIVGSTPTGPHNGRDHCLPVWRHGSAAPPLLTPMMIQVHASMFCPRTVSLIQSATRETEWIGPRPNSWHQVYPISDVQTGIPTIIMLRPVGSHRSSEVIARVLKRPSSLSGHGPRDSHNCWRPPVESHVAEGRGAVIAKMVHLHGAAIMGGHRAAITLRHRGAAGDGVRGRAGRTPRTSRHLPLPTPATETRKVLLKGAVNMRPLVIIRVAASPTTVDGAEVRTLSTEPRSNKSGGESPQTQRSPFPCLATEGLTALIARPV